MPERVLITAILGGLLAQNAFAKPPSQQLVDSCLNTDRKSRKITYLELETDGWHVTKREDQDSDFRKKTTAIKYGKGSLGIWESNPPQKNGLVYDGKEVELKNVIRLDKRHEPSPFTPFTATWATASEGADSYFCITFNFDGIGQSGSFQNARGLYVIDRKARPIKAYYATGDIGAIDN